MESKKNPRLFYLTNQMLEISIPIIFFVNSGLSCTYGVAIHNERYFNVVSEKCSNLLGRRFVKIQYLTWSTLVKMPQLAIRYKN